MPFSELGIQANPWTGKCIQMHKAFTAKHLSPCVQSSIYNDPVCSPLSEIDGRENDVIKGASTPFHCHKHNSETPDIPSIQLRTESRFPARHDGTIRWGDASPVQCSGSSLVHLSNNPCAASIAHCPNAVADRLSQPAAHLECFFSPPLVDVDNQQ